MQLAENRRLKLTVGHNYQFTLEMLEMRRLVTGGFLGGRPGPFRKPLGIRLGRCQLRRANAREQDPLGSPVARVSCCTTLSAMASPSSRNFLMTMIEITAHSGQSPRLQSLGGREVLDELRVLLRDKTGMTAFFCFSTQLKDLISCVFTAGKIQSLSIKSAGPLFETRISPARVISRILFRPSGCARAS